MHFLLEAVEHLGLYFTPTEIIDYMQPQKTPELKQLHSSDYGIIHYRYRNGVAQQRIGFGDWTRKAKITPEIAIEEEELIRKYPNGVVQEKEQTRKIRVKLKNEIIIEGSPHQIHISDPSAPYTPPQTGIKPKSLPKLNKGRSTY